MYMDHQPQHRANPKKQTPFEIAKSIVSTLGIFLLAPVVAILLTTFVFRTYEVEGQSMERTLQDQDRLIIHKWPKTWSTIRRQTYQPKRGQIVVFTKTTSLSVQTNQRQLIKRVVGIPGDHIIVNNGTVTIYNDEHPGGYNPDKDQPFSDNITTPTSGNIDVTVDEGHVFVLGDNRPNSQDSRVIGQIKTDTIHGTLSLRIYPFDKFENY